MVLCSGAFDGLHAGHVAYLAAAKVLCGTGEPLLCAVAPDAYIERMKARTPRWRQQDRLLTVAALKMVDRALMHESVSVADLIEDLKPRLFVKGSDWMGQLPGPLVDRCNQHGVQIVFVPTQGRHTSETRA